MELKNKIKSARLKFGVEVALDDCGGGEVAVIDADEAGVRRFLEVPLF